MRLSLLAATFFLASTSCTNVYTLGPTPHFRGLSGLVLQGLWSTTTRFDDRSETPEEKKERDERRASAERLDALRDRCIERMVEKMPDIPPPLGDESSSHETPPETPANQALDHRCAVIGY